MPGTVVTRLTLNRFPELARRLPREVNRICETSAKAIAEDAVTRMGEEKTGRIYGTHQASAPGEAPAIDTGFLGAIKTEPDGSNKWVTFTEAEYAIHLEYGAPNAGIAPRPFFIPTTEAERPNFERALSHLEDRLR